MNKKIEISYHYRIFYIGPYYIYKNIIKIIEEMSNLLQELIEEISNQEKKISVKNLNKIALKLANCYTNISDYQILPSENFKKFIDKLLRGIFSGTKNEIHNKLGDLLNIVGIIFRCMNKSKYYEKYRTNIIDNGVHCLSGKILHSKDGTNGCLKECKKMNKYNIPNIKWFLTLMYIFVKKKIITKTPIFNMKVKLEMRNLIISIKEEKNIKDHIVEELIDLFQFPSLFTIIINHYQKEGIKKKNLVILPKDIRKYLGDYVKNESNI